MELIAYLIGLAVSVFLSLPPPVQLGVAFVVGGLYRYRQGAVAMARRIKTEADQKAEDDYRRRIIS